MNDATPNIDQKKFPDIQDYSDWQSARILELTKRIAALEAEVLHENDLFITWRAKAEELQAILDKRERTDVK